MGFFAAAAKFGIAKRVYTEVRKQVAKRQGTSSSRTDAGRRPARRRKR